MLVAKHPISEFSYYQYNAATHDCCLGKLLYIMPSQSNEIGRNGSLMSSVFVFSIRSKYVLKCLVYHKIYN